MNNINYRIFAIISGAWRRRYAIAIPILILPIFAILLSVMSQKNYASHTSMLIQETAKLNPFLEDLAVSAMLKERMSALKTLLHSRHILGAVAEELALVNVDTSAAKRDEVIAQLSAALSVDMLGKDLIRIGYRSDNPQNMKQTLESISKQFVEQLLAPERSSMTDSSYFLAEHLKSRQAELNQAELAMAEFKDKHAVELPEMHLTNISRLAKMKQRLSERQAEVAGAIRRLGSLDQQLSKANPVLGRIEEQIVKIQGELALLRARYTNKHSAIITVQRNLRRLEEERQNIISHSSENLTTDQLWIIASSSQLNNEQKNQPLLISQLETMQATRSKVEGYQEEITSLIQMITVLEDQTSGYGASASALSKLEREVKIKRDLYDDMLLRYEKASITGSLGIFERDKRVKVIDRPFTPTSPSNPPLLLFVISGLVGGLFLGCGLAIILELSDTTLRRREQLTLLTGVPVLSRIPYIQPNA